MERLGKALDSRLFLPLSNVQLHSRSRSRRVGAMSIRASLGPKGLALLAILASLIVAGCSDATVEREKSKEEIAIDQLSQLGTITVEQRGERKTAIVADFSDARFSDSLLYRNAFTEIGELNQLRSLNLSRTDADDDDLAHLKGLTLLTDLNLDDVKVTDKGLANLSGLTRLEVLRLRGQKFTDKSLAQLESFPFFRNLITLSLAESQISKKGFARLTKLERVAELDLSGTTITDAGLGYLKGLTTLRDVDLSDTAVTDAGLVELKKMMRLGTLDLSRTAITDSGLAQIAEFSRLTHLTLSFGDSDAPGIEPPADDNEPSITGRGLEKLRASESLKSLWITGKHFTDDELAHVKCLVKLNRLGVVSTKITDEGLKCLKELPNLESLSLDSNDVGDAGLVHLQGLAKLRELSLGATKVTDAGVKQFRVALPYCEVLR